MHYDHPKKTIAALLVGFLFALTALFATTTTPSQAFADTIRMQSGAVLPQTNKANAPTMVWAGQEWYVVGDGTTGLNPGTPEGTVTLLSKTSLTDLSYRVGAPTDFSGAQYYGAPGKTGWYYASRWGSTPTEYSDSTVQRYLAGYLQSSASGSLERAIVVNRDLSDVSVTSQPLWLLSQDEELNLLDQELVPLGLDEATGEVSDTTWWTRTLSADTTNGQTKMVLADPYGSKDSSDYIHNQRAVRAGAGVDLSDVVYTSVASAARGKTLATVGAGMVEVTAMPKASLNPVYKYTIESDSLTMNVKQAADDPAATGFADTLKLDYSNATTAEADKAQTVSALFTNTAGVVAYYGKISNVDTSGAGTVDLSAAGVADGAYTLSVFNEQSNTTLSEDRSIELYSDFCSAPTTFDVFVHDGKITTDTASHTITYVLDGGALPEGETNPTTHKLGDAPVDLVAPARKGYTFGGWYPRADFSGDAVTTIDDGITGDMTLYAKWTEAAKVTINYIAGNGGTVTPNSESLSPSTGTATGSVATPSTGYHFVKWTDATDPELTPVSDTPAFIPSKEDGAYVAATYVANFKPNAFTVTFDGNGGTGSTMDSRAMTYDEWATLPMNTYTRAGYTFQGWSTDPRATAATYKDGQDVINLSTEDQALVTLYAVWTESVDATITYEAGPGGITTPASESVAPATGSAVGSTATPKTGYHFTGWTIGEITHPDPTLTPAQVNASAKASGIYDDTTFKANFEPNTYTVTFHANGGTGEPMASQPMTYDAKATLSNNTYTNDGFVFMGWSIDASDTTADYTDAQEVTNLSAENGATVALYAVWAEASKVTLTYESNNVAWGTVSPASESVVSKTGEPKGSTATAAQGYTFEKWTDGAGASVSTNATFVPERSGGFTEDENFSAIFKPAEDTAYRVDHVMQNANGTWSDPEVESENKTGTTGTDTAAVTKTYKGFTAQAFDQAPIAADGSTVITVRYARNAHGVTYHANGHGSEPAHLDGVLYDCAVPLPAEPYAAGFTFEGWYSDPACTPGSEWTLSNGMPDADLDLYAKWTEAADITITYIAGPSGDVSSESETLAPATGEVKGSTATAYEGSHFARWTNTEGGTVGTSPEFKPVKIGGLHVSATYVATFAENTYTVAFDANGGVGEPMADQSLTYGAGPVRLSKNTYTRPGYTFAGWALDGHSTTPDYADNSFVADLTENDDATVVLHAVWLEGDMVVIGYGSADDSMGSVSPTSETLAPASGEATGSTATPAPGHAFVSWIDTAESVVSEEATFVPSKVEGLNVAATYTATFKPASYDATFDPDNGSAPFTSTVPFGQLIAEPTQPVKAGSTFEGWYTTEGEQWDFATQTMPEGGVSFVAHWTDNAYTVFYDAAGGLLMGDQSKTVTWSESGLMSANEPTYGTYHFDGWFVGSTKVEASTTYASLAKSDTVRSLNLIAHWSKPQVTMHTVTFDSAGGSAVPAQTVEEGSAAVNPQPAPTREGYQFLGWFAGEQQSPYAFDTPVYEDITLTAHWHEQATVKVSFAITGDAPEGWELPRFDHLFHPGDVITLDEQVAQGWTFDGWYAGSAKYGGGTQFTVPASDVVLTGTWTEEVQTFTVSFDTRGGSGSYESQHIAKGKTAAKPVSDPSRDGFVFKGWTLNGATWDFATPVTADIILVASWERAQPIVHTVTFDLAGGKGQPPIDQKVTSGDQAQRPIVDPERDGYRFFGWAVSGGSAYDFTQPVITDLNLVATWVPNTYLVTYQTNGAASIDPLRVTWDTASLNAPSPTRDGHVFAGWYYGDKLITSTDTYGSLSGDPDAEGITLSARWTPATNYSVNYDAAGGIGVPGKTDLAYNSANLIADAHTSRDGYSFLGWYYGDTQVLDSTTYADLAQDASRVRITLVAHWQKDTVITFDLVVVNGGAAASTYGALNVTKTDGNDIPTPQGTPTQTLTLAVNEDYTGTINADATISQAGKDAHYRVAIWTAPDGSFLPTLEPSYTSIVVPKQEDGTYASGTYTAHLIAWPPYVVVSYASYGATPDGWVDPVESIPYYFEGEDVIMPQVPEYDGWKFTGWTIGDRTLQPGEAYTVEDVEEDGTLEFVAGWEQVPVAPVNVSYAVTGDIPAGWNTPTPLVADPLSELTLPEVATYEGYTFDGWYLGSAHYLPGSTVHLPMAGDARFTGEWTKSTTPVDPVKPDTPDQPETPDDPSSPSPNASVAKTGDTAGIAFVSAFALVGISLIVLSVARRRCRK